VLVVGEVTHAKLVKVASEWMAGKASLIATEIATTQEVPDVIAWGNDGVCTVIECKVSRSDYLRESKKVHHVEGRAMGDYRWYMAPEGLLKPSDIPKGFGLLEYKVGRYPRGYCVRRKVEAPLRRVGEASRCEEKKVLISIAWRSMSAASTLKLVWMGEKEPEDG